MRLSPKTKTRLLAYVAITKHFEQAWLLSTGWSGERRGQLAEVKFPDVQWYVSSRAHLQMGHTHGVITCR